MRKQCTNEELVKLIQEGHKEYIEQLWMQVEKFVSMKVRERIWKVPDYIGASYADDLYQSGYFALLDAVELYSPGKGAGFLTYLSLHLKRYFNETLNVHTANGKREAHLKMESWDATFPSTDDLSLEEVIPDPHGQDGFDEIAERSFQENLREYLLKAINELQEQAQQEHFLTLLRCNCDRVKTREVLRWTIAKDRKIHDQGLSGLRRYMINRRTAWEMIGIEEFLGIQLYRGNITKFKNNCFTSSTEMAALRLCELEKGSDVDLQFILNHKRHLNKYSSVNI